MLASQCVQIGVVASIPAERVAFPLEAHHLAVQGEHLLDKGAAIVQKRHIEAGEILGLGEIAWPLLCQILGHERSDRHDLCREGAALDAGLQSHGGPNARQLPNRVP